LRPRFVVPRLYGRPGITCNLGIMVTTSTPIAQRIAAVREKITLACERADRDPAGVRLVGAAKTMPAAVVAAAITAGLTDVGENQVQEAVAHRESLGDISEKAIWRLIGHLQTNKVRDALAAFDWIDGVDSLHLAQALSRRAVAPVKVLLEVNVGAEDSK